MRVRGVFRVARVYLLCSIAIARTSVSHGHGAYHDFVAEITREIEKSPNDVSLRFRLACSHQEHGEWTAALEELERVERQAPGQFETPYVQGQALATGGQWLAAKSVLDDFLEHHQHHAGALAQRGRILLKLDKPTEALTDFRTALGDPKQSTVDLYLEAADAFVMGDARAEAVTVLRRSLQQHGALPALLLRSLDLELDAQNFDEALARVDALQKALPRPEPWMAKRAQVLTQAKREADAKQVWTALRDHLLRLPNLELGMPQMTQLLAEAQKALGMAALPQVIAPPLAS